MVVGRWRSTVFVGYSRSSLSRLLGFLSYFSNPMSKFVLTYQRKSSMKIRRYSIQRRGVFFLTEFVFRVWLRRGHVHYILYCAWKTALIGAFKFNLASYRPRLYGDKVIRGVALFVGWPGTLKISRNTSGGSGRWSSRLTDSTQLPVWTRLRTSEHGDILVRAKHARRRMTTVQTLIMTVVKKATPLQSFANSRIVTN